MEITNQLRRTKAKLSMLQGEEAPIFQVLFDLLDVVADYHDQKYNPKLKQMWVDNLKENYKMEIRKLTPENPKQKKLDL
jgi:hypothetical protein